LGGVKEKDFEAIEPNAGGVPSGRLMPRLGARKPAGVKTPGAIPDGGRLAVWGACVTDARGGWKKVSAVCMIGGCTGLCSEARKEGAWAGS